MSWNRPISTSRECAAQRAAAISRQALPTLGMLIAIRGTRHRLVRSIGGCRSTSSPRRMRWRFTRAIGMSESQTARPDTIITPGTSCIAERVSRSLPRRIRGRCHARPNLSISIPIRLICPVGGLILFSAAQMHSSVPNTSGVTQFSIDFRTIHRDDAVGKKGARNIDAACTGTVLRDFLRGTDLTRLPQEIVGLYDDGVPVNGDLIYMPKSA